MNVDLIKLALFSVFLSFGSIPTLLSQTVVSNADITRRSVVFIYTKYPKGNLQPDGTGFLLSVPLKSNPGRSYLILVTARHMADPGWIDCGAAGELVARMNKKEFDPQIDQNGTIDYSLAGRTWMFPADDSVDIAYTFLDDAHFDFALVENAGLGIANLPSLTESKAVQIGDEVNSAGLLVSNNKGVFENALSNRRNYPVFKFGHISSIPQEKIAVSGCNGTIRLMTEWMVAANLIPGNSGSPIVFQPSFLNPRRPVMLGVQSIAFAGDDVAGMAPIRYLLDAIRSLNLPDADLSKPADPASSHATPTSLSPNPSLKPDSLLTPK